MGPAFHAFFNLRRREINFRFWSDAGQGYPRDHRNPLSARRSSDGDCRRQSPLGHSRRNQRSSRTDWIRNRASTPYSSGTRSGAVGSWKRRNCGGDWIDLRRWRGHAGTWNEREWGIALMLWSSVSHRIVLLWKRPWQRNMA